MQHTLKCKLYTDTTTEHFCLFVAEAAHLWIVSYYVLKANEGTSVITHDQGGKIITHQPASRVMFGQVVYIVWHFGQ